MTAHANTVSASIARLRHGPAPVAVGVAAVLGVTVADMLITGNVVLISLLIVGPLLCGLTASPAATRRVAAVAITAAAASFVWDHTLGSWRYWVPLSVVIMGSLFAAAMASYRDRLAADAERLRSLSEALSSTESQLQAILAAVDAAVTVRDTQGRMVYANRAAADLLKLADPDSVMSEPPRWSHGPL